MSGPARYAVGLCLDRARRHVLLVRKMRPAHLADQLNAIGGHIDDADGSNLAAMRREWAEEVGVTIIGDWRHLATLNSREAEVVVFTAVAEFDDLNDRDRTRNDAGEMLELVQIVDLERLPVVPDMRWLVPLAVHQPDTYVPITVTEPHYIEDRTKEKS